MKHFSILISAVLILSVSAYPSAGKERRDTATAMEEGFGHLNRKEYAKAESDFTFAINEVEPSMDLLSKKGPAEGLEEVKSLIEYTLLYSYPKRALARLRQGNTDGALSDLQKVISYHAKHGCAVLDNRRMCEASVEKSCENSCMVKYRLYLADPGTYGAYLDQAGAECGKALELNRTNQRAAAMKKDIDREIAVRNDTEALFGSWPEEKKKKLLDAIRK